MQINRSTLKLVQVNFVLGFVCYNNAKKILIYLYESNKFLYPRNLILPVYLRGSILCMCVCLCVYNFYFSLYTFQLYQAAAAAAALQFLVAIRHNIHSKMYINKVRLVLICRARDFQPICNLMECLCPFCMCVLIVHLFQTDIKSPPPYP